jgi:hypothetical protein
VLPARTRVNASARRHADLPVVSAQKISQGAVCRRIEALTGSAAASHPVRFRTEANLLNKGSAETEAQERATAITNAVYADCRSRCISDAGRRLVNTVLAALAEFSRAD